jgi:hypothetical protein
VTDTAFQDRLDTRLLPEPGGRVSYGAAPPAAPQGLEADPAFALSAPPPIIDPATMPSMVADAAYRARRMRELAATAEAALR